MMSMSPAPENCALAMTTFSYMDEFAVTCCSDTGFIKDTAAIVKILEEEIEAAKGGR